MADGFIRIKDALLAMDMLYRQDMASSSIETSDIFDHTRAKEILSAIPAIDAEEVVRCKDCIFKISVFHPDDAYKNGGYMVYGCEKRRGKDPQSIFNNYLGDYGYCSEGELR